jgi:hypothetical protein
LGIAFFTLTRAKPAWDVRSYLQGAKVEGPKVEAGLQTQLQSQQQQPMQQGSQQAPINLQMI